MTPPDFVRALKTAFKPNATIPTIWLVATTHELLFCNTHRSRFLWKRLDWANVNEVRARRDATGGVSIVVRHSSPDVPDFELPVLDTGTSGVQDFINVAMDLKAKASTARS